MSAVRCDERGAVALGGVLLLFVLGLLLGSGVDLAHGFVVRDRLNAIASDAALAGASQLNVGAWRRGVLALDPSLARAAAEGVLARDGGIAAAVSADSAEVSVRVSEPMPTVALRFVGIAEITVTALAHAVPQTP